MPQCRSSFACEVAFLTEAIVIGLPMIQNVKGHSILVMQKPSGGFRRFGTLNWRTGQGSQLDHIILDLFQHLVEEYRRSKNLEIVGGCSGNSQGPIADVTCLAWISILYHCPRY